MQQRQHSRKESEQYAIVCCNNEHLLTVIQIQMVVSDLSFLISDVPAVGVASVVVADVVASVAAVVAVVVDDVVVDVVAADVVVVAVAYNAAF